MKITRVSRPGSIDTLLLLFPSKNNNPIKLWVEPDYVPLLRTTKITVITTTTAITPITNTQGNPLVASNGVVEGEADGARTTGVVGLGDVDDGVVGSGGVGVGVGVCIKVCVGVGVVVGFGVVVGVGVVAITVNKVK